MGVRCLQGLGEAPVLVLLGCWSTLGLLLLHPVPGPHFLNTFHQLVSNLVLLCLTKLLPPLFTPLSALLCVPSAPAWWQALARGDAGSTECKCWLSAVCKWVPRHPPTAPVSSCLLQLQHSHGGQLTSMSAAVALGCLRMLLWDKVCVWYPPCSAGCSEHLSSQCWHEQLHTGAQWVTPLG